MAGEFIRLIDHNNHDNSLYGGNCAVLIVNDAGFREYPKSINITDR